MSDDLSRLQAVSAEATNERERLEGQLVDLERQAFELWLRAEGTRLRCLGFTPRVVDLLLETKSPEALVLAADIITLRRRACEAYTGEVQAALDLKRASLPRRG